MSFEKINKNKMILEIKIISNETKHNSLQKPLKNQNII